MITLPDMVLFKDGVEITPHRSPEEALQACVIHGPGVYRLVRPDGEIVVPESFDWQSAPEPQPEPDPSTKPPSIHKRINREFLLNFDDWNAGHRYTRGFYLTILRGDTVRIYFDLQNMTVSGGGRRRALEGDYTLIIDRELTDAKGQVSQDGTQGWFDVPLSGLADGWHVFDITESGEETSVPYCFFVFNGDTLPKQEWIPAFTGSYEKTEWFNIAWVSVNRKHNHWPCPKRAIQPFDYIPHYDNTFVEMLTGAVQGQSRRISVNKDGIYSTAAVQDYHDHDLIRAKPRVDVLPGPRGQNAVSFVTHITPGMARQADEPESPLVNNTYLLLPWGWARCSEDGTVTPLCGHFHRYPASYWEDEPVMDLYGDYSEIEESRRRHQDMWGQCWIDDTTKVDHDAEPIDGRQPHTTGPMAILADAGMDALRSVEFSATDHGVPPKVREFYRGADPWAVSCWRGNKLIVSERQKHRIIQLDSKGNFERTIIEGEPLTYVDSLRKVKRLDTRDACRQQDVAAPEDNNVEGDWCYFADPAQEQLRRVQLIDGRVEVVIDWVKVRWWMKFAISNGDTGPEGTIFMAAGNVGKPQVYTPDGTKWALEYPGEMDRGRGNHGFTGMSYATSVACGNGQVWYASAMEGVRRYSLATDDDPVIDRVKYITGKQKWQDFGYSLSNGSCGQYGALPWGADNDMDYYMTAMGH